MPSLRRGNGNNKTEVMRLQQQLATAGFYHGDIDGKFGRQTEAAVTQFQAKNGLSVNGMVNRATAGALDANHPNVEVPPANPPAQRYGVMPSTNDTATGGPALPAGADLSPDQHAHAAAIPAEVPTATPTDAAPPNPDTGAMAVPPEVMPAPNPTEVALKPIEVVNPDGLKRGAKTAAVADIQSLLNGAGATLDVDGKFGPKTEAAVIAFQTAQGLDATGKFDTATLKALNTLKANRVAQPTGKMSSLLGSETPFGGAAA